MLFHLFGLMRRRSVFPLDFLFLNPLGNNVLPAQFRVVPQKLLPFQIDFFLFQFPLRQTDGAVGLLPQTGVVPAQERGPALFREKFPLVRGLHRHAVPLHFPEFPVNFQNRRRLRGKYRRFHGSPGGDTLRHRLRLKSETVAVFPGRAVIFPRQPDTAGHGDFRLRFFQFPAGLFHPPLRLFVLPLLPCGFLFFLPGGSIGRRI